MTIFYEDLIENINRMERIQERKQTKYFNSLSNIYKDLL